eukprot:TRINITY_DN6839_c0_g1_i3.p1 TRINITY_DN6839_c0_g1~~TRINITY_DN6839_c0_g1_i3.p1  ORF type:complete len:675 (-),score=145.93 TRINITY_DN6839_c0_g1_i3:75-2099(-)
MQENKNNVKVLNTHFKVESYNGGTPGDTSYAIDNALQINSTPHCTKAGKGFDLILKCIREKGVILTHFMIRGGENCTAPIKSGAIWFHDSPPDISQYVADYPADYSQASHDANTSAHKPTIFFQTDKKTLEFQTELQEFVDAKYIHIRFLAPWDDMNIDVGYIGLVGYEKDGNPIKKSGTMGDIPEDLNLTRKKPKPFNVLSQDFLSDIRSGTHLYLFTNDDAIRKTVKEFAEAKASEFHVSVYHSDLPATGFSSKVFDLLKGSVAADDKFVLVLASVSGGDKYLFPAADTISVETLTDWLRQHKKGELEKYLKSAPRPEGDSDAAHPGLTILVADSFKEIVLDETKDVFVDVYADWCGPCRIVGPKLADVAKLLKDTPSIVIGKLDSDANDKDTALFPETYIPIMKMFPAGDKTPLPFEGERTRSSLLSFILSNAKSGCSVDKDALLAVATRLDSLDAVKASQKSASKEVADSLKEIRSEKAEANAEGEEETEEKGTDEKFADSVQKTLEEFESSFAELMNSTADDVVAQAKTKITAFTESADIIKAKKLAADLIKAREKKHLKNVLKCYTAEEYNKVMADNKESDKLVVIDFFATWCPPCKRISPVFAQLSEERLDIQFVKIDVDELADIAKNAGISAMPTFHFYRNGEKVAEMVGGSESTLRAKIDELTKA